MQSFGDQPTPNALVETPPEIDAWQDPSVWTPDEEELPPVSVPEGLNEADVLEQSLPA